MADTKISALTVATTPLAGTEVLPIVQGGVTKQVSVADLTAGRAVSAASLTLTTALTAANGGTGQSSYAVGDLLYASTTTALSKLADVATGNALISGGVGVAPLWGKIGLTTHVSGTLPVGNGGTGQTSWTSNGVLYASATTTLATTSTFAFDGSNLGLGVAANASTRFSLYKADNTVYTSGARGYLWQQVYNTSTTSGAYCGIEIGVDGVGNGSLATLAAIDAGSGTTEFAISTRVSNTFADALYIDSSRNIKFVSGNLTQGTAAKGINFTANTAAAGKTSQLLNYYEEGTWTPSDQSGAGLTFTTADGYYTKIGRMVYASFYITYPVTVNATNNAVGGLPFTAANTNAARGGSALTYSEFNTVSSIYGPKNNTLFSVTDGVGNSRTNAVMSGKTIMGCIIYFT